MAGEAEGMPVKQFTSSSKGVTASRSGDAGSSPAEVTTSGIEKGVPLPHERSGHGVIPGMLMQMEVGDSIRFSGTYRHTIAQAAGRVGDRMGWVFTVRKQPGGYRVWRVL